MQLLKDIPSGWEFELQDNQRTASLFPFQLATIYQQDRYNTYIKLVFLFQITLEPSEPPIKRRRGNNLRYLFPFSNSYNLPIDLTNERTNMHTCIALVPMHSKSTNDRLPFTIKEYGERRGTIQRLIVATREERGNCKGMAEVGRQTSIHTWNACNGGVEKHTKS